MDIKQINYLIDCLKMLLHRNPDLVIPVVGNKMKLELKSDKHLFLIDVNRAGHKKPKCTYQLREQQQKDFPLMRLDLLGPTHKNPPGDFELADQDIPCPHIHIADPEYGTSIAYPLNHKYANMYLTDEETKDLALVLQKFLKRCNVGNFLDYNISYQPDLI
ncbi:DUF6978 family protein [Terribacillus saccharophilus]|uniref:Uncharacterized protein n=1 Tax=Terribacillus saccharophilus TaxID=361277 RepID=A0A268AC00_9BACI|nr:hypothetical protein [Terribacillus saccharophilus]PAD21651.1 hypothetical protein CHH64_07435 [Terribacillus saccharophilus]